MYLSTSVWAEQEKKKEIMFLRKSRPTKDCWVLEEEDQADFAERQRSVDDFSCCTLSWPRRRVEEEEEEEEEERMLGRKGRRKTAA